MDDEQRKKLTDRQQRVLDAIRQWIRQHGYPPTIRELGRELGIKSLRGVTTHLETLTKKGAITRAHGARGIRIITGPMVEGLERLEHIIRIPILGRVVAGQPLMAEENREGELVIDALLVEAGPLEQDPDRYFALKVKGDSMSLAGILDGDQVIVRQQQTAENGDIVVALVDGEATVKRFFKEEHRVRLQPEHPTMAPIIVEPGKDLAILGKVVSVFRQLP